MAMIKRMAKKLQEEYEEIANGKKTVWGSHKRNLVVRKKAEGKAKEMKKFLGEL